MEAVLHMFFVIGCYRFMESLVAVVKMPLKIQILILSEGCGWFLFLKTPSENTKPENGSLDFPMHWVFFQYGKQG